MTFKDHFSAVADGYSSFRPHYPEALFSFVASLAPGHRLAWDAATGSGQAATGLAPLFDHVEATDASSAQVAQATPHPKVSYRVEPAEASGLSEGSVDLVTIAQALHWLDLDRFYAEVARVLRPGGLLAAWCYVFFSVEPAIDRILDRYYHQVVGPFWPPERRLVETGYRTLPFPFPELAAPPFAVEERWDLPHLTGYLGTWSATRRAFAARGTDPVDEVRDDLTAAWGDPTRGRDVRWPLSLRVGRRA